MTIFRFRFITGRWHASAWGSHVNEGLADWPPAPWRLLRALIATWFRKYLAEDEAEIRRLIEALASATPVYGLPEATASHSRHYMPVNEGRNEERTKVFDAFLHVTPGECLTVHWPVDLEPALRELLAALLASLNYLGRAESLVEAALLPAPVSAPVINMRQVGSDERLSPEEEPVRLLAPMTEASYRQWLAEQPAPSARRGRKRSYGAPLPETIFDALLADTNDLRADGWSLPPGARWIDYARPLESIRIAPSRMTAMVEASRPTVARFAVLSAFPPQITAAVALGERFHRALVSRCSAPVFTGCDEHGAPLQEGHQHAYYLTECDRGSGRVSFLTIFARMGFDGAARRAFEGLRQIWRLEGGEMELVFLGTGDAAEFTAANLAADRSVPLTRARAWDSLTPFVPTRHPKLRRNGQPKLDLAGRVIGSPEHDLLRLLQEAGFPAPTVVEPLAGLHLGRGVLPWGAFQQERGFGGGRRAGSRGYGFRLCFDREVAGPLAFGYGAHFGLGLFVPADDGNRAAPPAEGEVASLPRQDPSECGEDGHAPFRRR